jgi:hypothetical protein
MVELTQVAYGGWENNYKLSNGKIELVLTGEVGIRVIRLGFVDDVNEFYEDPDALGKGAGDDWRLYGGHRFWHAPEAQPRTYYPDNNPVTVAQHDGFVRVTQPVEPTTGMVKEVDFYMSEDALHVKLVHRMTNTGMWAVTLAPWALSVMAGGTMVAPLPPRGTHPAALLPVNTFTAWAYTDMSDPRWTWGHRYVLLRQDPDATTPQKIGMDVRDEWVGSVRDGHLFLKLFQRKPGAVYPDMGCTVETFTNDFMLEVETLGPLAPLEPGASVEHVEDWFLFDGVQTPTNDDQADEYVLPRVREAHAQLNA